MRSALAVWQAWNVDAFLREAYESGVILAGMSAGAMCWFDYGIAEAHGRSPYSPPRCLGIVRGACAVHFSSEPQREVHMRAFLASGGADHAIGIDDGAAALFEDGRFAGGYRWMPGARVRVFRRSNEAVEEECLRVCDLV